MLVLIYFSFISFYSNWEALCSVYNVIRTKKNKTSQSFSCKLSIEKKLGSKKSASKFSERWRVLNAFNKTS